MKALSRFLVYVLLLTALQGFLHYYIGYWLYEEFNAPRRLTELAVLLATMVFCFAVLVPNIISGLRREKRVWIRTFSVGFCLSTFLCCMMYYEYPHELKPFLITGVLIHALKYPLDRLLGKMLPEKYR